MISFEQLGSPVSVKPEQFLHPAKQQWKGVMYFDLSLSLFSVQCEGCRCLLCWSSETRVVLALAGF